MLISRLYGHIYAIRSTKSVPWAHLIGGESRSASQSLSTRTKFGDQQYSGGQTWSSPRRNKPPHYSETPHLPWGRPNGSPPRAIHQPRKIPIRTIVHGQAVFQKAQMGHRNPTKPLCK